MESELIEELEVWGYLDCDCDNDVIITPDRAYVSEDLDEDDSEIISELLKRYKYKFLKTTHGYKVFEVKE